MSTQDRKPSATRGKRKTSGRDEPVILNNSSKWGQTNERDGQQQRGPGRERQRRDVLRAPARPEAGRADRHPTIIESAQTAAREIKCLELARASKRIARFTAVIGLAGTMIDAGNQYLDLNTARNAAVEFYANGSRLKGLSQRLPKPLRNIMSEGGWTILEEVAKKLGEEGIWHLT